MLSSQSRLVTVLMALDDRLFNTGSWAPFDLIKYLASIRSSLTPGEITRLRDTNLLQAESSGAEAALGASGDKKVEAGEGFKGEDCVEEMFQYVLNLLFSTTSS